MCNAMSGCFLKKMFQEDNESAHATKSFGLNTGNPHNYELSTGINQMIYNEFIIYCAKPVFKLH